MRIDFSDQVAVVTGAGGGIGRAVALALSDIGAKLRRYSNQGGRRCQNIKYTYTFLL